MGLFKAVNDGDIEKVKQYLGESQSPIEFINYDAANLSHLYN